MQKLLNQFILVFCFLLGFTVHLAAQSHCFAADFEWKVGYDGCTVEFTNLSSGDIDNYYWDFNDGAITSEEEPSHYFDASGCYTVFLEVTEGSEVRSITKQVCVISCNNSSGNSSSGPFTVEIDGPDVIELGNKEDFTGRAPGAVGPLNYFWQIKSGQASPGLGSYPLFRTEATSDNDPLLIELTITDADGEVVSATKEVHVTPGPINCDIIVKGKKNPNNGSFRKNTELKFRSKWFTRGETPCYQYYGGKWTWDFMDGSLPEVWAPGRAFHKYSNAGNYNVKLTACKVYPEENICNDFFVNVPVDVTPPPPPQAVPDFQIVKASDPTGSLNQTVEMGSCTNDPYKVKIVHQQNINIDIKKYIIRWKAFSSNDSNNPVAEKSEEIIVPLSAVWDPNWWDGVQGGFPLCPGTGPDAWDCFDIEAEIDAQGDYSGPLLVGCDNSIGYTGGFGGIGLIFSDWHTHQTNGLIGCIDDNQDGIPDWEKTVSAQCVINVEIPPLEITDIQSFESVLSNGCKPAYLQVVASKGAMDAYNTPPQSPCEGEIQVYRDYEWKAYSASNINEEIPDFFITDHLDIGVSSKCMEINLASDYVKQFQQGSVDFYAEVKITDWLGDTEIFWKKISMNSLLPLQLNDIPGIVTRCPDLDFSFMNGEPLALGGQGNLTFMWSGEPTFYFDGHIGTSADSDDPNPTVNIPALTTNDPNFNPSLDLTVQDECFNSVSQQIFLDFDIVSGNTGPIDVKICYDKGSDTYNYSNELGVASATGGSGNYIYSWFPSSNLSDPNSSNPIVTPPTGNPSSTFSQQYDLQITDEYGCTWSTSGHPDIAPYPVIVSSHEIFAKNILDAGDNQKVCIGDDLEITIDNPGSNWSYNWTSDNPLFPNWPEPNLAIFGQYNNVPGTYTYQVKRSFKDPPSLTCFQTDEVEVEVLKPWIHEGFESEIVNVGDLNIPLAIPTMTSAWNTDENRIITHSENPNSGAEAPFSYQWLPNSSGITTTQTAGNSYPIQAGMFLSQANPNLYYDLELTDANGCKENFRTNRILPFNTGHNGPQARILASENTPICVGQEMCFTVELTTHFMDIGSNLSANLPPSIESYFVMRYGSGQGNSKSVPQPAHISNGFSCYANGYPGGDCMELLTLYLVEGSQGVYEGEWCFTFDDRSGWSDAGNSKTNKIRFEGLFPSPWEEEFFFHVNPPLAPSGFIGTTTITQITNGQYTGDRVEVGPNATWNRPNWITNTEFIAGGNDGVDLQSQFEDNGHNFHAYIDGCEGSTLSPTPEKNVNERISGKFDKISTPVENSFLVFPNPFNSEIKLKYAIGSEDITKVSIRLFSPQGQVLKTIVTNREHQPGEYIETYNSVNLPPGVYFFELLIDKNRLVRKAVKIANR